MLRNRLFGAMRPISQRAMRPNIATMSQAPRMFTTYLDQPSWMRVTNARQMSRQGVTPDEQALDENFYRTTRGGSDWAQGFEEPIHPHSLPKPSNTPGGKNAILNPVDYNQRIGVCPTDDPMVLGISIGCTVFALPGMWYWYHYIFNETFLDHGTMDKGNWREQWEADKHRLETQAA